jgi:hypothetical protein
MCAMEKEISLHEKIRKHFTALNIAWQRYARALEQQLNWIPFP